MHPRPKLDFRNSRGYNAKNLAKKQIVKTQKQHFSLTQTHHLSKKYIINLTLEVLHFGSPLTFSVNTYNGLQTKKIRSSGGTLDV
jgi:hypothetical protein